MTKKPTRMEQIGSLLTAMIAVVVTGKSNLIARRSAHESRSPFPPEVRREFLPGRRYHRLQTSVAARLGVRRESVSHVVCGDEKSLRIMGALRTEMALLDGEFPAHAIEPLSIEERKQFARGGKYYGVYSSVAKALKVKADLISLVGRGHRTSLRRLMAIRAEMARIDAELAAKRGGAQ